MTLVPAVVLWPEPFAAANSTNMTLDAASEKAASIFHAPVAGDIDKVWFRTGNVVTGETVDCRLETVDTTTGAPTGTLVGTNTNASQVIANADDNVGFEVTLTAAATVTKGQLLSFVIAMPGVTSGNLNIVRGGDGIASSMPYTGLFTGTWALSGVGPVLAVHFTVAGWVRIIGAVPALTVTSTAYSNGSNPDERGNRFELDHACKVTGAWHRISTGASGAFDLKLYDSADVVLAALSTSHAGLNPTNSFSAHYFDDADVTLVPGTYRLTKRPTTNTDVSLGNSVTAPSGYGAALPGAGSVYRTTRNNDGAWTDDANSIEPIGLILSALDDGAGGAAGGGAARRVWGRGGQH